jgi:hypothetical protein
VRTKGRVIGLVAVSFAAALAMPIAVRFALGIHEASSLPHRIYACDRQWNVDSKARMWSLVEIMEGSSGRPTIVNPGPFGLFTVCPFASDATVDTVLYVRVDLVHYVDYALSGGP